MEIKCSGIVTELLLPKFTLRGERCYIECRVTGKLPVDFLKENTRVTITGDWSEPLQLCLITKLQLQDELEAAQVPVATVNETQKKRK